MATLLIFSSCAKLGGGAGDATVGVASSIAYTQSPAYYAVGVAITPNVPIPDKVLESYTLHSSLPAGLSFETTTGTISGTPTAAVPLTAISISGTNSYGTTYTTLYIMIVNGPPSITYSSSSYAFNRGIAITSQSVTNSGDGIQSCSVSPSLPTGLSLNSSTCQISGTPSALSSSTSYTVTASNAAGDGTKTISISVTDIAPVISFSPSSRTLTKGVAVSFQPSNSGGTITGCTGTLPAGLSLASDCTVSGTPTALGSGSYTVTASNSAGSSPASISLTVNDAAPSITFSPSSKVFYDAVAISSFSPSNSGGTITGCSSSPSLPSGLSISSSCLISGTPTAVSASATYLITATNTGGFSQKTLTITVNETAPSISYSPTSYTYNKGASATAATPTNSGGNISSCTVVPSLPAGLGLSVTCSISGTPTVATPATSYTVTATNSAGSSSKTISITVTDALTAFSYPASPYIFTKSTTITTITPTSTGGTITSCSVSPSLPTGLSLNTSNCSISGTPTAITSATSYTVTGTNAAGNSTASINITVNDRAPSISYAGSPYNFNLSTLITTQTPSNTGGTITGCTASPSLPTGLSLSTTTCAISGTPSVLSSLTSYTITATNTGGSSAVSIQIQVTNSPPAISYSPSSKTYTNGVAISTWSVTNSGGSIASCAVSPALPGGLSLSTSTCAITGTPTAVSSTANYTVTATNNGGSSSTTISILVSDAIPIISYSGSPYSFGINQAISSQTPSSTGGVIASCSSSPALPAGLSISSVCVISGTPTVQQSATNYTITATNTAGSATANISIAVINVPSISYPSSPYVFTKGTAISAISPTNTGSPITSCSLTGTLPTGLTYSTTTCAITGTPTALKTATTYTVTPSNSQGAGSSATVNITVVDVAPTISYTPTTYTFSRNVLITNATPTLGGGTVTGCTASPTLPAGLSISNTTCVISGTPSAYASSQTYTITASNTGGSASEDLTISVNDSLPALAFSGSPYSWNINSSVGTITPTNTGGSVVSCSASPALPAGLSLSNTCVITGTPTVMQSATNYTITATDTGGSAAVGVSIAVIAAPVLSYPSSPYIVGKNSAISTITPTNTGSPTTSSPTPCSVSPSLPAGLSLDTATCAISGTPTVASAATDYTVTGYNTAGNSSATVNITVIAPPAISYPSSPYVFTLRTTISSISVTNSGGAISSCSASPSLPSGLTLSTTCGVSGAPTSTSSTTNYTITATNLAGSVTANLSIRVKDLPEILFYGYTNINGFWNQAQESSLNVFRITEDGQSMNAITQNTSSGLDSFTPSFIGTGGSVIFSSLTALTGLWNGTSPGSFYTWSAAATGGSLSPLSSSNNATLSAQYPPIYSPNGSQIAFVSKRNVTAGATSSYNIWIMNADGSSATALTQNTDASTDAMNPVFSPDGTKIYFQSKMNNSTTAGNWDNGTVSLSYNIWSVTTDGATLSRLTNETSTFTQRDCIEPAVSPDGNYVVYVSKSRIGATTANSDNIWYISSSAVAGAGTALTRNTSAGFSSSSPSFSPDGTTIVFNSLTSLASDGGSGSWNGTSPATQNIWTATNWSSTPTFSALTSNTGGTDSVTPSFAPDGSKIVFSSQMDVSGTPSSSYNIFIMDTNGSNQTALTQNTNSSLDSYLAPSYIVNSLTSYMAPRNVWYIAQ